MDILRPIIKTPRGNLNLLVIADRYSNLVRTVPLDKICEVDITQAFTSNWNFPYGIPRSIFTNNDK